MLVIDPNIITDAGDYKNRVSEYARSLRETRPVDPDKPVRVPFERSAATRAKRIEANKIEVADEVYFALTKFTR